MIETKTLTTSELIEVLKKLPNVKIYLSQDSEGNGFSTIDKKMSISLLNNSLVIYPFKEGLQDYEIE